MSRDPLGRFQLASILQIGRDAGRPERVAADLRFDPGFLGPAADHPVNVGLRHWLPQRVRGLQDRVLRMRTKWA